MTLDLTQPVTTSVIVTSVVFIVGVVVAGLLSVKYYKQKYADHD